ncbi:hypothetical protein NE237_029079 [Protea cynaroides]|uniref:Uncharacterized protein n=1 Tax=Protea cynaroides TaxID=273540 RepID=A0A9Q0JUR4_9MAGN|nr:hypothetical protein NE237_029079 [Protea cynaroides]
MARSPVPLVLPKPIITHQNLSLRPRIQTRSRSTAQFVGSGTGLDLGSSATGPVAASTVAPLSRALGQSVDNHNACSGEDPLSATEPWYLHVKSFLAEETSETMVDSSVAVKEHVVVASNLS